jgi:hypothetical protein
MKRILKIAIAFVLVLWFLRAFALTFRMMWNAAEEGKSLTDGIVWKTVLLPRFDNGFERDRIGELIGSIALAFLIVKRKISWPK